MWALRSKAKLAHAACTRMLVVECCECVSCDHLVIKPCVAWQNLWTIVDPASNYLETCFAELSLCEGAFFAVAVSASSQSLLQAKVFLPSEVSPLFSFIC